MRERERERGRERERERELSQVPGHTQEWSTIAVDPATRGYKRVVHDSSGPSEEIYLKFNGIRKSNLSLYIVNV